MSIPKVNVFLPLCMMAVIVLLCLVSRHQEKTIQSQREQLRAVVELWQEDEELLQIPCEKRQPSFQDNKRNQTVLAQK